MPDAPDPVLAPLDFDAFLESHFEQRPLHVERADAAHFRELIRTADIERLLAFGDLRFPDAQLSRSQAPIDPSDYIDAQDRLIAARVAEHHAAGATIVLSQAERRVPGLAALCRSVQRAWRWRCQTNVYYTPANAQGFGTHYDAHDVFVLQVEGEKTFRFHAGGPSLPFNDERFDKAVHAAGMEGMSVRLTPGDTLYIPRGTMHDAVANDSGASLHVTLGVFVTTALELAIETLRRAADLDPRWRRALSNAHRPALSSLLTDAVPEAAERGASEALADAVALDALPPKATLNNTLVTLSDTLFWQDGAVLSCDIDADRLHLRAAGAVLELNGAFAAATRALRERGALPVAALTGLDDAQRLSLAQRLCASGVARTTEQVPA